MPRIDELLEKVGHANFITTFDLCKGYWQVPLEEKSKAYTAFQFRTMPFGLHGAPASFQRLMGRILQDCSDFSAAYLDDVVIFSNTWPQHLQHLHRVLGRIKAAGLTPTCRSASWPSRRPSTWAISWEKEPSGRKWTRYKPSEIVPDQQPRLR